MTDATSAEALAKEARARVATNKVELAQLETLVGGVLSNEDFRGLREDTDLIDRLASALEAQSARIEEMERALEWKPVETFSHGHECMILVLTEGGFIVPVKTDKDMSGEWLSQFCFTSGRATHWMFAPPPPGAETAARKAQP